MKCSFCKQESIYFRKNEGHYYCKNHFTDNIEKRVKKTISVNKLIENGDIIAVALSGGKDSANVLFLLTKVFEYNPKINIFAITVDEGIKGHRDSCIKKSESLCKKLKVKQYVFNFKKEFGFTVDELSKKMKSGYCEECGLLKRYLLNKRARELGATKVALGDNLDDECQSIVMNLLKGDMFKTARIGSIPQLVKHSKFVTRIKPLILIPENESILYGKINNIPSFMKECNHSIDNSLRNEARNFLNNLEESSLGIKYSLYESAIKMKPFVNKFNGEKIIVCKKCGEPSSQKVCKVCELRQKLSP